MLNEKNREDQTELATIAQTVRDLAASYRGDSGKLLELLRLLESLHREVREEAFQEALPSNRQALYALLRDIERSGGWPYIPGMKLRSLLAKLDPVELEQLQFILPPEN
uniref:Uncharacterized protein n=1 Tax=Cyanothece sp. (strain PCC 7425 / ATCC 29141) TaxID=395961 RepID=B8HTW8_CYAP4